MTLLNEILNDAAPAGAVLPTPRAAHPGEHHGSRRNRKGGTNPHAALGVDLSECRGLHDVLGTMKCPRLSLETLTTSSGLDCPGQVAVVWTDPGADAQRGVVGNSTVTTKGFKNIQPDALIRPIIAQIPETRGTPNEMRLDRGLVSADRSYVSLTATIGAETPIGDRKLGETWRRSLHFRIANDGSGAGAFEGFGEIGACLNGQTTLQSLGAYRVTHRGDVDSQIAVYTAGVAAVVRALEHTGAVMGRHMGRRWSNRIRVRDPETGRVSDTPSTTVEIFRLFCAAVYGAKEAAQQIANGGSSRRVNAMLDDYHNGAGGTPEQRPAADGTAYGLAQALTQGQTHRGNMTEARQRSVIHGDAASQSRYGIVVAEAMTDDRPWLVSDLLDPRSELMIDAAATVAGVSATA